MCGGEHAACGPSSTVPVDERIEEVAAVSGPLHKYKVTWPSGVETVMKLNDEDAAARGLTDADLLHADIPPDDGADQEPAEKARGARNKVRAGSRNKAGGDGGGT